MEVCRETKLQKVWPGLPGQKIQTIYFPRKEKTISFSFENDFIWEVSRMSYVIKSETNRKKSIVKTFLWQSWGFEMFSEAKVWVELGDKTIDKSCCFSPCVCKGFKSRVRPVPKVFWPDMVGGKVMTSDSLTKVWLEESCRVGRPGDHGQSRGCKHKIAVTRLRVKHIDCSQTLTCKDLF